MSKTITLMATAGKQVLLALVLVCSWQLAIAEETSEEVLPCNLSRCFGIDWKQPFLQDVRNLNPHMRDINGSSPLHYAVRNCIPSSHVHSLALKGADVNEIEPTTGFTPLQLSLIVCRTPMLELLLNLGADPNAENAEGGGNLLHLAIKRKRPRIIIQRIVRSQVNLDAVDHEGLTPLVLVLADGDLELANLLLDAGANPNVSDSRQVTPAHFAAQKLNHEFLGKLVRNGADLDMQSESGRTAAHYAAAAGMTAEMAAVFFEANADMNIFDNSGLTPLHYASAKTPAESVAALLVLRANPQLVDGEGNSALHYALTYNNDPMVVRALLRLGADPNLVNNAGNVPIELSVGHPAGNAVLLELIAYGSSVDWTDESGRTLLHSAIEQGDAEAAVRLLEYGADPDAKDISGVSPIKLALDSDESNPARPIFEQIYQERQEQIREAEERYQARVEQRRISREDFLKRREQRKAELKARAEERKNRRQRKTSTESVQDKESVLESIEEIVSNEELLGELEQVEVSIRERLAEIQKLAEERRKEDN